MQILGKAIRRALMLGLAALTATVHGDEPPLDVVARAIEHHGGETYRASETQLDVCSKSGCFRVVARVDGGNFEYTVSGRAGGGQRASGGRREVRWSNDALEVRVDGEPQAVAAGDEQRFRDWAMARVYFCFLPYRLGDPSVRRQDLGLVDWGDRRLHKVKVTLTLCSSRPVQVSSPRSCL